MHLETTKLRLDQFARAALPWGTTTVVLDPHEIANVFGIEGVRELLRHADEVPLDAYVMVSSCVPASPFESSGATLTPEDIAELLRTERRAIGLAEMMDYPAVVAGDEDAVAKVAAAGGAPHRRARARALGPRAERVPRRRGAQRSRMHDVRGGAREAPPGDVDHDPPGLGGAEPRGPAPARARARDHQLPALHGRSRAARPAGARAHQRRGPRGGGARLPAGGRRHDGHAQRGQVPPPPRARRRRARLPRRHRRRARPRLVPPRAGVETRPAGRRRRATLADRLVVIARVDAGEHARARAGAGATSRSSPTGPSA